MPTGTQMRFLTLFFKAALSPMLGLYLVAQESLATAEQDYISAMYSYQLARAALARATGAAGQSNH